MKDRIWTRNGEQGGQPIRGRLYRVTGALFLVLMLSVQVSAVRATGGNVNPDFSQECVVVDGLYDRCEEWVASLGFARYEGFAADASSFLTSQPMALGKDRILVSVPVQDSQLPAVDDNVRYDIQTAALDMSGERLWTREHQGSADGWDVPFSVAASPTEDIVYVAGLKDYPEHPSFPGPCRPLYASGSAVILAYDAEDGTELWVSDQTGGGTSLDAAFAVEASPDGKLVYIAGTVAGGDGPEPPACDYDFAVAALDASTGREVWMTSLDGTGTSLSSDRAFALTVTPDGGQIVAVGRAWMQGTGRDFLTVALDAVGDPDDEAKGPGGVLWSATYDGGRGGGRDDPSGLALSPEGSKVFVTGTSHEGAPTNRHESTAYATVAYDVETGEELWTSRYTGETPGAHLAHGIAVDPAGAAVYVTGMATGVMEEVWDYATVAYGAQDGEELWVRIYHSAYDVDLAWDVAIGPDGGEVYVTGQSAVTLVVTEAATLAYDDSGNKLWTARFGDGAPFGIGGRAWGRKLSVTEDGDRLVIFGQAQSASVENTHDGPNYFPYRAGHWWKIWSYPLEGS